MTENMSTEVTEYAPTTRGDVQSTRDKVSALASGNLGVFTTIQGDDFAAKTQVLAALTDAAPLSDHLGETIDLANIVAQVVEVADEEGVLNEATRVILVDANGNAFAGLSDGLFRSVQNIISILGHPATWPQPYPMKVVEKRSRRGFKFYTIVPA